MKRTILITNDDGIEAQGLKRLAQTALEFGDVYVVAPDGQRSAVSHAYSYASSLIVKECDIGIPEVKAFSCSGTPADCARIGILKLLPSKPDVVFSGINNGFNMAADIQYSGTVGAALEASFLGVRAIAFSEGINDHHEVTSRYLKELIAEYIDKPAGENRCWNINFPECRLAECKGILRDRTVNIGLFYDDAYEVVDSDSKSGSVKYELKAKRLWDNPDDGSDLQAVINNYISVGSVNNIS